jgi:DNA-binding protein Fis
VPTLPRVPTFLPDLAPRKAIEPATELSAGSKLEALIGQRLRDGSQDLYEEARRELDRFLLPLVLRSTEGNQLRAARILGIARRTLRLKLRELGLSVTKSVEEDEDDTRARVMRWSRRFHAGNTDSSVPGRSHPWWRPARLRSHTLALMGRLVMPFAGEIRQADTARLTTDPLSSKSYQTRSLE